MVFSRYLLMLAPLACAACAPLPHAATTRPAISGSLTSAGAPVVGREIWAAHGTDADPCARPSVQAATNQDGKFTLPRQTELRLIYAPWFTSSELITLCVATTDKPLLILRVGFLPTTPPAIELACDLETPASRRTAWGLCRIDTTTGS